uniref:Cysteine dioxygenase n=1 Tax=Heterorhabditis bacteriophora TaxID=37862 RepID=A0A1I7WTN2_HETBA
MDPLISQFRSIFASNDVNIEEVEKVLYSYKSNPSDWRKYAHFDERNYTRNLVDTGNGKYNMIVLCWGPGMCTNIHDHSGSHCYVKVLEGELLETKFAFPDDEDSIEALKKIDESRFGLNEVTYMSDQIGLHRMENPSHSENAVSLHLYCPAYDECNLFDQRTSQKHASKVTFWSKFGKMAMDSDLPFDPIATCSRRG